MGGDYGNTFDDLDKLMIKQLEMEEALLNKDEKINQIKRITLIETEFKALKAKEEEARREDEQRQEDERLEARKKKWRGAQEKRNGKMSDVERKKLFCLLVMSSTKRSPRPRTTYRDSTRAEVCDRVQTTVGKWTLPTCPPLP